MPPSRESPRESSESSREASRESRRELPLPPGYRLDRFDPDVLLLRSPEGEIVARFSTSGYSPESVEREAWEDHGRRNGEPRISPFQDSLPGLPPS